MKKLFLWVLIPVTLWSNSMECEYALSLFDKSVQEKKPISDGLLMMTIVYCEEIPQYRQIVTQMMKILESAEIQTNTLLTPSSPNHIQ